MTLVAAEPKRSGDGAASPRLIVDGEHEATLLRLIGGAREELILVLYRLSLPAEPWPGHPVERLIEAVADRATAGVRVRILLDRDDDLDEHNRRAAVRWSQAGVAVRWDEPDRRTHTKALYVDGKQLLIGSANWSFSAVRRNREQSVLLQDTGLAARWLDVFERDWDAGTPFGPEP